MVLYIPEFLLCAKMKVQDILCTFFSSPFIKKESEREWIRSVAHGFDVFVGAGA
jgi:hypothetical protein